MTNRLLSSSSSISGTDVKNIGGDSLGSIQDLMINTKTGKIAYAVLSYGGFLGIGDKYFAIPWSSFDTDRTDEELVLNVSNEKLKNAPGFDKDNWPTHAEHKYLVSVNKYYNYEPAY